MTGPAELISKATAILGHEEQALAAGNFGLKDNYVAVGAATATEAGLCGAILDNPARAGLTRTTHGSSISTVGGSSG